MRARVLALLLVALPCSIAGAQETAAPGAPDESTSPSDAPPTSETGASPEAAPGSDAAQAAPSDAASPPDAAARTPKVAIVLAGDPDPQLALAARALEETLGADAALTMPSDPAIRAALRGDGHDDGLDDVRSERRRLGLGESRDVHALTVLGELVGADLVLVVRGGHGTPTATAFDVLRRSFYDGELALEPIDVARALAFVERRAARAAQPLAPGELTHPPSEPSSDEAAGATVASPEEAAEAATEEETPEHQPDFFEQYWPYFAAGALLVGAVIFVVFATQTNDTPPPVLRFHLGPD